jgi:hypothetical protein
MLKKINTIRPYQSMPPEESAGKEIYQAFRNTEAAKFMEKWVNRSWLGTYFSNIQNFSMEMGKMYGNATSPECIRKVSKSIEELGKEKGILNMSESAVKDVIETTLRTYSGAK